jgi:hypothetical protein
MMHYDAPNEAVSAQALKDKYKERQAILRNPIFFDPTCTELDNGVFMLLRELINGRSGCSCALTWFLLLVEVGHTLRTN